MSEGIRIRPLPDRVVPDNAMIVVRDVSRPLPAPRDGQRLSDVQPVCGFCGVQHLHKTYHIQLRAGSAIVSEGVWAGLSRLVDHGGFEAVNPVPDPPTQVIRPGRPPQLLEKWVPPITLETDKS